MKLLKKALICVLSLVLCITAFAACGDAKITKYSVTYVLDGGSIAGETIVSVESEKSITLPMATKSGFEFVGWFDSNTLVGKGGQDYKPTKDVTLTARWNKASATNEYASINRTRALEYAKKIHEDYWNADTQKSSLTPTGGVPYLWPNTEQPAMVNAVFQLLEPTDADYNFFKTYLQQTMEGLRYYRVNNVSVKSTEKWENENHVLAEYGVNDGTANSYAIYQAGRGNTKDANSCGFGGVYFDDNIWVAKEFYNAYINLGDIKYLNESINIVNWIIGEGYEPTKGMNGIYWNWGSKFLHPGVTDDSKNASLNACSSAPTAMMLVKLYNSMNDAALNNKFDAIADNYLSTAKKIYNFLWNTLRDEEFDVLKDKVFVNKSGDKLVLGIIDQQELPYNTGTFMTLGAELYSVSNAAGQTAAADLYKTRNIAVAKGSDKKFANTLAVEGQFSYNKNSWFTSFILEGFIDILPQDPNCNVYIEHMRSALDYGFTKNRAQDGYVCPAWVIGWSEYTDDNPGSEGNPRQILLQSANAHCYAMLANHYSKV